MGPFLFCTFSLITLCFICSSPRKVTRYIVYFSNELFYRISSADGKEAVARVVLHTNFGGHAGVARLNPA